MTSKTKTSTKKSEIEKTGAWGYLIAVALFGFAALILYVEIFQDLRAGAFLKVLEGLGGNVMYLLPLCLVWAGVLALGAARGKKLHWWRIALNVVLMACVFAAVHLFFAERIISGHVAVYTNFIYQSYTDGIGGGAIGSLLSWPLYSNLGVWGGLIALIAIMLLISTATGNLPKFVRWINERAGVEREKRIRLQAEREAEQLFDLAENYDELDAGASVNRSRRRAGGGKNSEAAGTDMMRTPRSANGGAGGRNRKKSVRGPRELYSTAVERSGGRSARRSGTEPFAGQAAAEEASAVGAPEAPASVGFGAETIPSEMYVPDIKANSRRNSSEKAFKPDRPSAISGVKAKSGKSHGRIYNEDVDDEFMELNAKQADGEPGTPVKGEASQEDDLKIEPIEYETADDDPPFDMPAKQVKPRGKFKRVRIEEDDEDAYNYPPLDLLSVGETANVSEHRQADMEKAHLLEDTLKSFGISTKLTGIAHGPAVTRFELQPAPGIKVSRITALSDDIALNLAATRVRIEAPIPGKAAVGVEIPNDKVEMVRLRDVLESPEARRHTSKVAVGLGKDNSGRYIVADIAKMPHVLIAGQTGSGKSVCINSLIVSILFRAAPDEVKLILIDPKVVELSIYNDIPHLISPVVTDPKKAASALDWAVAEMGRRYKSFAERGVRDIKGYNKALEPGEKLMPQIVIIIDELADLMMVVPGEVEDSICRLAQLARAAGMHLVIATQRPSVNVITGIIKANIPTRIAFSVASQIDSRTMIDHGGAEKLLGNGDMLFVPSGIDKPIRVQGAWVSDEEVRSVVDYIKARHESGYDEDMVEQINSSTMSDVEKEEKFDEYDPRLPEAVEIVIEAGQASISMLQRRMRVGYARAGRLIDEMALRGLVSEADGAKPRTVLITREEFKRMFEDEEEEQ